MFRFTSKMFLLMTLCGSMQGHAAHIVRQTLTTQSGKSKIVEQHRWTIEDSKFRLDSDLPDRKVHYIFNGRTLFACIKVTDANYSYPGATPKQKQETKALLSKGICLSAPINITTSFFISPHNSVSALDITESLALTLNLDKYNQGQTKMDMKPSVAKSCDSRMRTYDYTYFAYSSNKELTNSASEQLCLDGGLNWRKGIWRQLSRTLLQQSQGRKLRQELAKLELPEQGIAYKKSANYVVKDGSKVMRSFKLDLDTTAIEEVKSTDKKTFSTPFGYQIISNFDSKKDTTKEDIDRLRKGNEQKGEDEESILPQLLRSFLGFPI